MQQRGARRQSMARVFLTYAVVGLVLVVVLGLLLASSYRREAQRRGVAEGRSEAILIAETAVEPLLDGRPLDLDAVGAGEQADLRRLVRTAVRSHEVLRLRLRDLQGNVVFSDDGSGFTQRPEDEALDAAQGHVVARLTHLNADSERHGADRARAPSRSTSRSSPAHRCAASACSRSTCPTRPSTPT